MTDQASPQLHAALRETLAKQMEANDPPEVAATFARLQREGFEEDIIWRLLSAALLQEIAGIVGHERTFDRAGYVAALHRLPTLSDR